MSDTKRGISSPSDYCLLVLKSYLFQQNQNVHLEGDFPECQGLFVTYKIKDVLRGCIGTFQAHNISEAIDIFAIKAAQDHRMPKIVKNEFYKLTCKISVLHSFEICKLYEWDISDGISFEFESHRATFLPGIAIEQVFLKN